MATTCLKCGDYVPDLLMPGQKSHQCKIEDDASKVGFTSTVWDNELIEAMFRVFKVKFSEHEEIMDNQAKKIEALEQHIYGVPEKSGELTMDDYLQQLVDENNL